ncbi:MAG: helix-turn-helix transcriptional regulator [Defluviitaleaceae bacterium]|nr:helix-turn-helix transcriptional regulator [Defluviitaleaceae bacterium]
MLPTGEKIRQIRKAKGLSQENLAYDIGLSTSTVCRIEQGIVEINGDILKSIKKALEIESAPLLPGEGEGYKERLHIWHKLILDGHLIEARTLQKDLADITALPFEKDLVNLYSLFEISLLLAEQDYTAAKTRLQSMDLEMNRENQYHYYRNMGWLYMSIGADRAQEPLEYLLKAYSLQEKPDGGLYYRIARCYTRLGQPFRSIAMLEKAYKAYGDNKTTVVSLDLDNKMALNYIDIGDTVRAREILEKCLVNARNISNDNYIGVILANIGLTYVKDKNWEIALDYYVQAREYFKGVERNDREIVYYKARCLIALRRFAQCKELLLSLSDVGYDGTIFDSLNHLITLREPASYEYLERVTIPFLMSKYNIMEALDFCEVLEDFHESRGSTRKALEFAKIQRDIYKGMISNL